MLETLPVVFRKHLFTCDIKKKTSLKKGIYPTRYLHNDRQQNTRMKFNDSTCFKLHNINIRIDNLQVKNLEMTKLHVTK